MDEEHEEETLDKHSRSRGLWIVLAAIFLIVNLVFGVLFLREDPVYAPFQSQITRTVTATQTETPFGVFPTVTVTSEADWPVVPMDIVTCVNQNTHSNAELFWVSVKGLGLTVPRGSIPTSFNKGCTTGKVEFEIPEPVRVFLREEAEAGSVATQWQLVGKLTPVRDDGREGVPLNWTESGFVIIYSPN